MRAIKFRGKSDEGWLYGSLLVDDAGCTSIMTYPVDDFPSRYPVSPKTVGQFTGLYDGYGKPIYEDDIVMHIERIDPTDEQINDDIWEGKNVEHTVCCVYWDELAASFKLQWSDFECVADGCYLPSPRYINFDDIDCNVCLQVIGNITDNPELLDSELTE